MSSSGRRARSASASRAISAARPCVGERLLHQPGELVPLLRAERCHQPLRRHGPAGQRVDQLLQVGRVVREHVPVAVHEGIEVGLGVLAPRVRLQHLVEVRQHVLDPLHRLRVRVFQRVLHAAELAVQHLAPEQVLELLERLPCGGRPPVVVGQPPDRLRGVGGQRIQFRLAHPGIVAGVGEQLGPLLADRRVQQRPGLFQDAVEAAAAAHLLLPLPHPAQHVVQPPLAPHPAPDQVTQGAGRVGPAEYGVPELVQGQPGVVGRRERIRAVAVLAVPVSHVRAPFSLPPSRALRWLRGRRVLGAGTPLTLAEPRVARRLRRPGRPAVHVR